MLVTAQNIANPLRAEGPIFHFAWKAATDAKQHIAIKEKNIWKECNTIAGFEIGIWES